MVSSSVLTTVQNLNNAGVRLLRDGLLSRAVVVLGEALNELKRGAAAAEAADPRLAEEAEETAIVNSRFNTSSIFKVVRVDDSLQHYDCTKASAHNVFDIFNVAFGFHIAPEDTFVWMSQTQLAGVVLYNLGFAILRHGLSHGSARTLTRALQLLRLSGSALLTAQEQQIQQQQSPVFPAVRMAALANALYLHCHFLDQTAVVRAREMLEEVLSSNVQGLVEMDPDDVAFFFYCVFVARNCTGKSAPVA